MVSMFKQSMEPLARLTMDTEANAIKRQEDDETRRLTLQMMFV